ncbi:hypothetical protein JTE90_012538 [Oedothorax gibbosus]|uniref:C2H2-type domain-containing protein n=1 Tax=Oedothorax gibbosus TaxID=931172 RepID=A0AAV6U4T3_9ARAC|nr:hypothetical protein JTE90_012538 [Oedothorax gibbosus]
MKVLSSLSNKSTTERCETVLKRKHRVIILNLNLISDDSNLFSENSFDDPTPPSSDSGGSPVKLDISKCFMRRKSSFDHEDSLEEPSRTSTPLPKEEEYESDDDSDQPKPRKVAKNKKKSPSFACHLCPKSFVYKIYLKKHLEQHKEGFHCKYCGRSFANKDKVSKHEKNVHVARTLYACDQCFKSFRANTSLTAHRALHSSTAEKFYCKYCGKNYVLKKSYKRHLQSFPSHDTSNDLKSL